MLPKCDKVFVQLWPYCICSKKFCTLLKRCSELSFHDSAISYEMVGNDTYHSHNRVFFNEQSNDSSLLVVFILSGVPKVGGGPVSTNHRPVFRHTSTVGVKTILGTAIISFPTLPTINTRFFPRIGRTYRDKPPLPTCSFPLPNRIEYKS